MVLKNVKFKLCGGKSKLLNIGVIFLGKIGLSFGHVSPLKAQTGMRKTADFGKNCRFW